MSNSVKHLEVIVLGMEVASAMMDDTTISLVVSALGPEERARRSGHVRSGGGGIMQITVELGVAGRTAAWPLSPLASSPVSSMPSPATRQSAGVHCVYRDFQHAYPRGPRWARLHGKREPGRVRESAASALLSFVIVNGRVYVRGM
jgi:hypothetical protein